MKARGVFVHRFELRVSDWRPSLRKFDQVAMVEEVLEQRAVLPVSGLCGILLEEIGQELLRGAARGLLAEALLDINADDFGYGERVFAHRIRRHQRPRCIETLQRDFERKLGLGFDALERK